MIIIIIIIIIYFILLVYLWLLETHPDFSEREFFSAGERKLLQLGNPAVKVRTAALPPSVFVTPAGLRGCYSHAIASRFTRLQNLLFPTLHQPSPAKPIRTIFDRITKLTPVKQTHITHHTSSSPPNRIDNALVFHWTQIPVGVLSFMKPINSPFAFSQGTSQPLLPLDLRKTWEPKPPEKTMKWFCRTHD